MNDMEDEIRKTLAAEGEQAPYDADREEGLREMMAKDFHGRHRWIVIVIWTEGLIILGVAVFAAVRFFAVEDPAAQNIKDWIFYAALFLTAMMAHVVIKLWYWMLIHRNSVQREIKRLELRILALRTDRDE